MPGRCSTWTSTCRTWRSLCWFGFLGKLDVAVVGSGGVLPDGRLIPSSSVGNNKTWLDQADKIILEVNTWHNPALEGMYDIYYGTDVPPNRRPIQMTEPRPAHWRPYLRCDPSKVIAVVKTHQPDRNCGMPRLTTRPTALPATSSVSCSKR